MVVAMMLALGATAFAAGRGLTPDQAKQKALDYTGVKAAEATFTKTHRDFDDGREVYEIKFYVGSTEYEMDVDVLTGRVTDFDKDVHMAGYGHYDDDDWFDWDD